MNIKNLVRDPAKIHAALQELDNFKVIAKQECRIYIPARFAERNLAELGVENYTIGICAIVVENFYAVMSVCAMLKIEPTQTTKIKISGDEYYEFLFPAGSTVFSTTELVKKDTLVYRIYDEIISKGKVPWYLNYNDLGKIFDTAKLHGGANIGQNSEVTELIVSMIARDRQDKNKYYRTVVNDLFEIQKNPPVFIPLRSVIYAATNTTNKLAGSYFGTSTVSALVSPATRTERLELLLRK